MLAAMAFAGFGAGAVAWFEGLERDNSKAHFDATRATFLSDVREPFEDLLDELSLEFGGAPSVRRQNRDIRFSPDKSPYKTRTYGWLEGAGRALYAEVSARGLYAGSGYWRMANDQLERFRAAAGDELRELMRAAERAGLELAEPALKVTPRGYRRDHPHADLLKYKSVLGGRRLAPGPEFESRAALEFAARTWRAAGPLNDWLDRHVGPSALPRERR
jgi:uncharacterized protein (TIGR02453 family)